MIDTSVHTVRADHVGSLLRTPALLDARAAFRQGKLDRKGLTAAEDKAILEVLDLQRQAGFTIFTDGEYRRELYFSILWEAVEGFSSEEAGTAGGLAWHEPDGHVAADVPNLNMPAAVIGKLRKTRRLVGQEIAFLKEHVSGAFKVTLPAPGHFHGSVPTRHGLCLAHGPEKRYCRHLA